MEILRETMSATQSVASAMAAVVSYWNGDAGRDVKKFGCRSCVESIQCGYSDVMRSICESRSYIIEHWNDVLQNGLLQREVEHYLGGLSEFFCGLRSFEREFCINEYEAFRMFDDAWIARKYFVRMIELQKEYELVFRELEAHRNPRPEAARPFYGMAYTFRDYFVGVTDTQLQDMILSNKPFPKRAVWLGGRVEATIFARTFGLTASLMNKCFLIRDQHGAMRKLNLTGDSPSRRFDEYGIWAPIEKYKHCRQ